MAAIQTVLFDLDGTLIDSVRLILDSYHHTLAAHGLPPRTDEDWLQGVGTPLTRAVRRVARRPATLEAMIATYREYNLAHHDRMVTVYPGVVAAVEAIRAAGRRTGLVTSKNRQGALRGLTLVTARGDDGRAGVRRRGDQPQAPSRAGGEGRGAAGRGPGARRSTWATASTTWCRAAPPASGPPRRSGARSAASHLEGATPDYWLETPARTWLSAARLAVQNLPRPPGELLDGERLLHEARRRAA